MLNKKDVLILASGSGSNAEALAQYAKTEMPGVRFVCGCNRTKEKAGVYAKLEKLGVETYYLPSPGMDFSRLRDFLANPGKYNPANPIKFDLILLAGYMRVLPDDISQNHNILNIHPSILPFVYKGSEDAYKDALDNGDSKTGCTVHKVTPDVDGGKIIAQLGFDIPQSIIKNKDLDTLKAIGLAHEHALYPAVLHAALFRGVDNIKLDMLEVAERAQKILSARNLDSIMRGNTTIIPCENNHQTVFDSWNAKTR
jgi:folate-dependent phosphoribosylglycinamide formyltransferase PurN